MLAATSAVGALAVAGARAARPGAAGASSQSARNAERADEDQQRVVDRDPSRRRSSTGARPRIGTTTSERRARPGRAAGPSPGRPARRTGGAPRSSATSSSEVDRRLLDVEALREVRDRRGDHERDRELPGAALAAGEPAREPDHPEPERERERPGGVGHAGRQDAVDEAQAVGRFGRQRGDDRDEAGDRREPGEQRLGVAGRRTSTHGSAACGAVRTSFSRAGGRGGARPPCPARGSRAPGRRPRAASRRPAISALPSRTTEISRAPSGSRSAWTRLPSQVAPLSTVTSTISRFSLRSSSRWIRPCSGTSCSIRRHDRAGRRDGRRDPEQVEVRLVARVVDARDHLRDAVALAGELADDDVVLVVAGRGDEQVGRPLDAGALEHEQLGRVAAEHLVLELDLELVEAVRAAARSASPRGRRGAASA